MRRTTGSNDQTNPCEIRRSCNPPQQLPCNPPWQRFPHKPPTESCYPPTRQCHRSYSCQCPPFLNFPPMSPHLVLHSCHHLPQISIPSLRVVHDILLLFHLYLPKPHPGLSPCPPTPSDPLTTSTCKPPTPSQPLKLSSKYTCAFANAASSCKSVHTL